MAHLFTVYENKKTDYGLNPDLFLKRCLIFYSTIIFEILDELCDMYWTK